MKIQLNIRLLPLLKTPKHRKGSFMPFSAPVFCSLCLWCSFVHVPMIGCGPCFCFYLGCVPRFFPLIGTSLTIRCWTSLFVLRTNPPPNTPTHAPLLPSVFWLGSWKAGQKEGAEWRLQKEGGSGRDGRKYFFPLLSDKNPILCCIAT